MIFRSLIAILTLFQLIAPQSIAQEAPTPVTISVAPGERQAFGGFGASVANWRDAYSKLSAAQREEVSGAVWKDLKFKTLRLWMMTYDFAPTPGAKNLGVFRKQYIDPGIVADAIKHGVTHLLLAPDGLPEYMKEKTADGKVAIKATEIRNYAALLADAILELKKAGIAITETGLQNEPSDQDRFTPEQLAEVVAHLRKELDDRGLKKVQIIATENASANEVFAREVDALKANPAAWEALAGIASHSYNMAANAEIASKIAGKDGRNTRQYWMTEASDNGVENAGDRFRAASLSARFLNDMNHRVTHWIHFLAFEIENQRDDATTIIKYTVEPEVRMTRLLKYDTYGQLSQAFDIGAVFRASTSPLEKEMTWTYGRKPRIISATAKNPDGTWSIGIANYTADSFLGVQGWSDEKWNREQGGYTPATSFDVTIDIAELRNTGPIDFTVRRTSATKANAADTLARMTDGRVTVRVDSLDVLTFRSKR